MARETKVLLVLPNLGGGGAQRYTADIASHWARRGRGVVVVTYDPPTGRDFELDPSVTRIDLFTGSAGSHRRDTALPATIARLRKVIRLQAPDVVVGMVLGANLLSVLATVGCRVPVVGMEPVYFPAVPRSPVSRLLQRVLYRRLTRLVVQSERTRSAAARLVGARRVAVIPNFVSPSILRGRDGVGSGENIDAPQSAVRIVTTSRLEPPKGHAVLLRALAVTRASAPWRLRVLGEGSQRDSLERLTVELGLADKVSFAGWTPDPVSTLRGSDIFVLASRFEGHPLSLIEAMSCGLAVIATDCPTGPAEFIRPDDNGLLIPVDDVPAMASALARLVDDPELRARLGASAATIAKDASIDKTAELWDALLADISGSPG